MVSVAVFVDETVHKKSLLSPRNASGVSLDMLSALLAELGLSLKNIDVFGADIGPGSFTGVKVGVTLAKTFGFSEGKKCAGFTAFDLISSQKDVLIPCRKDVYLYRSVQNQAVSLVDSEAASRLECVGYGSVFSQPVFPDAANADWPCLNLIEHFELVPNYILEPSISEPKLPYRQVLE